MRKAYRQEQKPFQGSFIRRGRCQLLALVLCSLLLAAASKTLAFETAGANSDFLIGISNAQSGSAQILGKELLAGSKAYFDLVNTAGGIRGRKIRLVVKDDGYEPDPALNNTNELITKDKVFFLFDYVGTPTLTRTLPLLQYYELEHIINFAPLTGADPQRRPPYDQFVFNIRAYYRDETHALVDYLYRQGYRRIGFLGQADAYGKSGEVGVTKALEAHGLKLAASATYRRGATFEMDMRQQVEALKSKGVDAVISFGVYGPCAGFIRDARLSGWQAPVAVVSFAGADELLRYLLRYSQATNRNFTENLLTSQVVPSPQEIRHPLVASYCRTVRPAERSFISLEGWLNGVVVVEALRRMRPPYSRKSFVDALESLHDWDPGLHLSLNFSPTNHEGFHKVWILETENLHWVPVMQGADQP